jgi:hypothetical protein
MIPQKSLPFPFKLKILAADKLSRLVENTS